MAKKRYQFNPQTLTYEVIAIPFRIKFYRVLRKILIGFILACIANLILSLFFHTPKMYRINKENNEIILKYNLLQDKIRTASDKLHTIRQRDNNVYRPLFGTDSLSLHGIYTQYPATKYLGLQDDDYTVLMTDTWMNLDALSRELYLASKSLDDLEVMSKDKELMAEAIPAIWPINKRKLRGNIGAFGTRRHPILGYMHSHSGIDMGANKGEAVYATGDGRVAFNNEGSSGYGKQVLLDHGFGYKTRYAHLSKIDVIPGQMVKRGEKIGEIGRTGRASGDHLHYEVIYRGRPVDPLNYFSRDMSEDEFAKIIENAQTTTYETQ